MNDSGPVSPQQQQQQRSPSPHQQHLAPQSPQSCQNSQQQSRNQKLMAALHPTPANSDHEAMDVAVEDSSCPAGLPESNTAGKMNSPAYSSSISCMHAPMLMLLRPALAIAFGL